jgi:protoporphyrinogen oxidase
VDAIELRDSDAHVHAGSRTVVVDQVWSTLPLPVVASLARAPASVREAAARLEYRALTLVYLVFEVPFVSEFDASYFPGPAVCASRVSEPKRYRDGRGSDPADRTVLCAEVPCSVGDDVWNADPSALGARLVSELATQDLPAPDPVEVVARRTSHAYPTYRVGFEAERAAIDEWVLGQPALLSLGRQGLFAHDNTHHALATAWAAADALSAGGRVEPRRWAQARAGFAQHVVED